MRTDFALALHYALGNEGLTFTDNPLDRGGPTKFGITKKAYEYYLGRTVPIDIIRNLSLGEAEEFYLHSYWRPLNCDAIQKTSFAIAIFDTAILYGVGTSALLTQRALSLCGATVKFDGILGDNSIAALNIVKEEEFLKAFQSFVLKRIDDVIRAIPQNENFRKGWTERAARLLALMPVTVKGNLA